MRLIDLPRGIKLEKVLQVYHEDTTDSHQYSNFMQHNLSKKQSFKLNFFRNTVEIIVNYNTF